MGRRGLVDEAWKSRRWGVVVLFVRRGVPVGGASWSCR